MTNLDDHQPFVDEPPEPYDPGPPPPPPDQPVDALPRDHAAEQAVLGAALADPRALDQARTRVTAPDFYDPAHETIWRALTTLAAADAPTDPVSVAGHLRDTHQTSALRHLGGIAYLHTLYAAAPLTPADAAHHATTIDNLARRRRAIQLLEHGVIKLRRPGPDADVDHVLNTTTNELVEARDNLANPPASTSWAPVELGPVLAGEMLDPAPTMLRRTDGIALLYDGAIHTIAGESESGKTWFTLIAALQLVADGHRVVFLDFEDRADRVIGRLMALGATPTQIRNHFAYIRPDRPLDDDGRAQLSPAITDTRLVIVDGVTEAMTMHGFDLNGNADAALFYGLIPRWIADHGPAVVMIDHVVKDKEKQDRFALGAQHKLAGIDGAAYIAKMLQPFGRGKRGLARIEVAKDRPGHVREHTFGRTIAEFTLDATASDVVLTAHVTPPGEESGRKGETFEPTHLMEKLSRAVQLTPGLSKKALEDLINGKTATKRLALELLVTRGYIVTKQGPKGRVEHYHHKPYYADGDPTEVAAQDPETEASA